ncbi:MAG TPA: recombinase family protein [Ktedonobacteraceae bacterium]|jgi:DNA invertase Pin-like site-specific DNA recombinase|nr:recombinase family protein [Ktedonobacteraceae bacterium]
MPAIVDIYCRTATEDDETAAKLARQEQICRDYCTGHGLIVSAVHSEVASGVHTDNRTAFAAMQKRYRSGVISGVVVSEMERVASNRTVTAAFITDLTQHNAALYCVDPTSELIQRAFMQMEG